MEVLALQSRTNRLKLNTVTSLLLQLTSIACGFIVPRLILGSFGSGVNGLVGSITQFLEAIAFLELGVGAVVQSSLYKPLAEHDDRRISEIVSSANRFFSKIGLTLAVYVAVLLFIYPLFVEQDFDRAYSALLILVISISTFSQYYFGVVDRLLLTADQRGYVQYAIQTITLLLNTFACAVLIRFGASIHLVKLSSSLLFLLRPVVLRLYVRRHYTIDRNIQYSGEPIRQKWNGVAQHIAHVVLEKTDVIVLTALSTLTNVSIYSVYHMVVYGIKNLILSMTYGVQALMGELIARKETEELQTLFDRTEWLLHTGTVFVFGCTGVLIVPFVRVYTSGVSDAEYAVPLFAALITLAHAAHCLRLPYSLLILAAGHYRQTQRHYIVAAVINVAVSVLTVKLWGLVGVAIGTLCAMAYQTIWMAVYDARHILPGSLKSFSKHLLVDLVTAVPAFLLTRRCSLTGLTYGAWVLLACKVAVIWALAALAVNMIAYPDKLRRLLGQARSRDSR